MLLSIFPNFQIKRASRSHAKTGLFLVLFGYFLLTFLQLFFQYLSAGAFGCILSQNGTKMELFLVDFSYFLVIFRKTADMRSDRAGSIGLRVGPPKISQFLMIFVNVFRGEF